VIEASVPLFHLARVIHNAALFASSDENAHPGLCSIRLRLHNTGPVLVVSALGVDGHRAGTDHFSVESGPGIGLDLGEHADFVVDAIEAWDVAKILRKTNRGRKDDEDTEKVPLVLLRCTDEWVMFELDVASYKIPTAQVLFPATIGEVFGSHVAAAQESIALSARYLAAYQRVLFSDAVVIAGMPVEMTFGAPRGQTPRGAVLIRMGESFTGLLMPMRTREEVQADQAARAARWAAEHEGEVGTAEEEPTGKGRKKSKDEGPYTLSLFPGEGEGGEGIPWTPEIVTLFEDDQAHEEKPHESDD
jgi:hypothetical protein